LILACLRIPGWLWVRYLPEKAEGRMKNEEKPQMDIIWHGNGCLTLTAASGRIRGKMPPIEAG